MTNTISADELAPANDLIRRDQWGRYLVVPPSGGNPVGYTRVTTVAKALESQGGLAPWKATMTACGLILRPGLRAQWEALLVQSGDPWYHNDSSKAECKRLVEDTAAAGGANDRKEMGSALHAITALTDAGHTPATTLTAETERDLTAYTEGLAAAGVVIMPGMIERVVVLDHDHVAGTFDRIVTVPGFDLPLIADLKTGADLSYSWRSIAVQLAAYSRANDLYEQGTAADGSEDTRHAMPYVDPANGLVMWLNAGTGRLELFVVDLAAGWDAYKQSMWARGWAKALPAKPLGRAAATQPPKRTRKAKTPEVEAQPADLTPLLEQSIAEVEARKPTAIEVLDELDDVLASANTPEPIDVDQWPAVRSWLQARIDTIGQHAEARKQLARDWPPNVPTLRASDEHSWEQLDAITALLIAVEAAHSLPFSPPRPGAEVTGGALVVDLFPGTTLSATNNQEGPA